VNASNFKARALALGRRRRSVLLVLLLILVLTVLSAGRIKGAELTEDAGHNAALSFYLSTQGEFSGDGLSPTYMREPLPIAVTAAHMALFTDIPESIGVQDLRADPSYTGQMFQVNLYYAVGLFFALWWLAWLLTRSHMVAALSILGAWLAFSLVGRNLSGLLTESPAALTLTLASATAVWLVQTKRWTAAILTGLAFGALALTKAAALYVSLVAMPLLAASLVLYGLTSRRSALALLGVTVLAFALTVTPWMTRNYVLFDDFAIAQRGGGVLLVRALKDQMTLEEYGGTFYAYSPAALKKNVFERFLGFERKDLQPGGRYERLVRGRPQDVEATAEGDPARAISFFGKAGALQALWTKELLDQGRPHHEIDRVLQQKAMEMIQAAPGRHLALTLPFAWRGLWSFGGSAKSGGGYLFVLLANLVSFSIFLAFPLVAVWRRRPDWLAFSLLGFGWYWFHALLTHFISRYSQPLIPLAVLSVLVLVHTLVVRREPSRITA
jgi:hypothetical protein